EAQELQEEMDRILSSFLTEQDNEELELELNAITGEGIEVEEDIKKKEYARKRREEEEKKRVYERKREEEEKRKKKKEEVIEEIKLPNVTSKEKSGEDGVQEERKDVKVPVKVPERKSITARKEEKKIMKEDRG